jgi:hypothetical protein
MNTPKRFDETRVDVFHDPMRTHALAMANPVRERG